MPLKRQKVRKLISIKVNNSSQTPAADRIVYKIRKLYGQITFDFIAKQFVFNFII